MDVELELEGSDANESSIMDIQDWIRHEQIAGLRFQRKSGPPKKGDMGVDPTMIIALSGPIIEGVKALFGWIKTRRRNVTIRLRIGDAEVFIDGNNLSEQEAIISRILKIMETQGAR